MKTSAKLSVTAAIILTATLLSIFAESSTNLSDSHWLITPELLRAGNLKINWQNQLPLKTNRHEKIGKIYLINDHIYALTNQNYMFCLNRRHDKIVWSRPFADLGIDIPDIQAYGDRLFCIAGDRLIEFDPLTGEELNVTDLNISVVCRPVRNKNYFYISAADNRVHAYRAQDKVQVFEAAAPDDSPVVALAAKNDFLVFATNTGNVICIKPDKPKHIWRFKADNNIVDPLVINKNYLYFACEDTYLYKLNTYNGRLVWKCQTEGILNRAPIIVDNKIFQHIPDQALWAIDTQTGQPIWKLAGGDSLLAHSYKNTYVLTLSGTMAVVDNNLARKVCSINFEPVSHCVSNPVDSGIYVAGREGRVACYEPIE